MKASELHKIVDIEYFEGPMLSLFMNEKNGGFYLYNWVDVLEQAHLWLVFNIALHDLMLYMDKHIDQQTLIKRAIKGEYYLMEIGSEAAILKCTSLTSLEFSTRMDLIPEQGFFFEEKYSPDYEKIVAFLNNHIQEVSPKEEPNFVTSRYKQFNFNLKTILNSLSTNTGDCLYV